MNAYNLPMKSKKQKSATIMRELSQFHAYTKPYDCQSTIIKMIKKKHQVILAGVIFGSLSV
jgi:uncharacterized protein involved in tolerance to divalent cations